MLGLCIKSHNVMTSYELSGRTLELIDELILLCDSFEILWWTQLWFNKI